MKLIKMKRFSITLLGIMVVCSKTFAQSSPTDPIFEGQVYGGKEQIEQVLQTQFVMPKQFQNFKFNAEFIVFFNIDSTGSAVNYNFEGSENKQLKEELKRMFKFLKFKKTLNLPDEERPYFLKFNISSELYNKYIKQKHKLSLKNQLSVDSSFVIYTRADKSPQYFKNSDEGLQDYFLSEMEYPKLAIEKSISGTVVLEFVVETNGYVTGINVKQAVNGGCTEEAIKLIKKTRWLPAELNGKKVRYKTSYPLTFNLRNTVRENSSSGTIGQ